MKYVYNDRQICSKMHHRRSTIHFFLGEHGPGPFLVKFQITIGVPENALKFITFTGMFQ